MRLIRRDLRDLRELTKVYFEVTKRVFELLTVETARRKEKILRYQDENERTELIEKM